MRRIFLAGAVVWTVAAGTSAASAADPFDWSGYYVGFSAGVLNLGEQSTDVRAPGPTIYDNWSSAESGLIGLVVSGYNRQRGNIVYGAEGDFGYASLSGSANVDGGSSTLSAGLNASARLRTGYAMDRTLLYATAGLGAATFSSDFSKHPGSSHSVSDSKLCFAIS